MSRPPLLSRDSLQRLAITSDTVVINKAICGYDIIEMMFRYTVVYFRIFVCMYTLGIWAQSEDYDMRQTLYLGFGSTDLGCQQNVIFTK